MANVVMTQGTPCLSPKDQDQYMSDYNKTNKRRRLHHDTPSSSRVPRASSPTPTVSESVATTSNVFDMFPTGASTESLPLESLPLESLPPTSLQGLMGIPASSSSSSRMETSASVFQAPVPPVMSFDSQAALQDLFNMIPAPSVPAAPVFELVHIMVPMPVLIARNGSRKETQRRIQEVMQRSIQQASEIAAAAFHDL
jgi:hypothetical protein